MFCGVKNFKQEPTLSSGQALGAILSYDHCRLRSSQIESVDHVLCLRMFSPTPLHKLALIVSAEHQQRLCGRILGARR